MKQTIGGDRLGAGGKQEIKLKTYSRSTHDLGYIWRSSMASGTLVPFMSELGLPGDNFDIDIDCQVLTLPTVGPLFGSYKVQLDVFVCPIRLYNGKLHMNKLGIGLDISEVKLPQIELEAWATGDVEQEDNEQINASSIFSYLGIRGLGIKSPAGIIKREFNAVKYLAYWDIYKNYYANKQEEAGVVIHSGTQLPTNYDIWSADYEEYGGAPLVNLIRTAPKNVQLDIVGSSITIVLRGGTGAPNWEEITLEEIGIPTLVLIESYNTLDYRTEPNGDLKLICKNFKTSDLNGTWNITDKTISAAQAVNPDGRPNLVRFPLENIDTMREDILKDVSSATAFKITELSNPPYGLSLQNEGAGLEDTIYSKQIGQEGLAIKTYQSDLFNNWISTEWIDGTNGVNEITSIDTTGGNFTIDTLNLASKVYIMLNRIAISGGTYDDWLNAVYTHERTRSVESPMYMGGLIKELAFEEVVSTADTEGENAQPLGTLAGRGALTNKNKGGKIKVKIDEPCYIMGIVSLTPRVDYSQGNKWDVNLKTLDDLHKPPLDAIGFQDLITDQMAWFDTVLDAADVITYKSAGKQPAWINYMTNVNEVRGSFAEKDNSMFMVLNRRYESDGIDGISDLTTYIDPSKFNHIFADTRLDAQNFWVQISNNITARRKMSAKVIPNL